MGVGGGTSTGEAGAARDPRVERTCALVHDAAVALFAAEGIDGFTMEALAERSGVARSTIYRHWPDRSELLAGVFIAVSPGVTDDEDDHLVERLARRAWTMTRGIEQERWGQLFPFVVAAAQHDEAVRGALDRFNDQRRSETRAVILQGAERGEVELPDHLELVLDRFIGPFFLRMLVTRQAIDDVFVTFQIERLLRELGLTGPDLAGRIGRPR